MLSDDCSSIFGYFLYFLIFYAFSIAILSTKWFKSLVNPMDAEVTFLHHTSFTIELHLSKRTGLDAKLTADAQL